MHPAQKPIPLASDGDVDAELSELLIDIDEVILPKAELHSK